MTIHSRPPGQEHGRQTTNSEAQHVWAHAQIVAHPPEDRKKKYCITPVSRKGLYLHQQRELRNLGLLNSPMVSYAEVAHGKENTMEYALVGETEHRSDGAREHRMEVYVDYVLDTGNPVSEHSLDGEVITIPNTFKEAMESPQVTKWKKASNNEMNNLQNHAAFNLVSSDSVPPEHEMIGTKWAFKVKANHTLKGRVVVQGWGQVSGIDCGCTYLPV